MRRPGFLASLIAPALAVPALAGCHRDAPAPPPLPAAALAAVIPSAGPMREPLARAVDNLFTDPAIGETRAVIVMHNDRIVAERYAPGYGPHTRFLGWSMSKSVTGVLIGLLVADGRLRLDAPAPIPLWQRPGDPRGEITLRQLLQMRSGLANREEADPPWQADTVRMLFLDGRDDEAAYAESQPLEAEPGRRWAYATPTSVILADAAAHALTDRAGDQSPDARRRAVADYLKARLFDPVGMTSAVAEYDAAGTLIGGSMVHATARDWAHFGEFLRNQGAVGGAQIVPREWVRFMTTPAPHNPGYGAQVWLNRPQADGHEELFPGRGPAGLFACIGHLGQYVLVSPAQKLTVVRLGKTDDADRPQLVARLADVVGLFGG